jgi:hypothetical protein
MPHHDRRPPSLRRQACLACAAGLISGAAAVLLIVPPLHLWAADGATVLVQTTAGSGETGVEVGACRLRSAYQAATPEQPARIVVTGSNPGAADVTYPINVQILVSKPLSEMSRVEPPTKVHTTLTGAITLAGKGEGRTSIDLPAQIPAGARIMMDIGTVGMAVKPSARIATPRARKA